MAHKTNLFAAGATQKGTLHSQTVMPKRKKTQPTAYIYSKSKLKSDTQIAHLFFAITLLQR